MRRAFKREFVGQFQGQGAGRLDVPGHEVAVAAVAKLGIGGIAARPTIPVSLPPSPEQGTPQTRPAGKWGRPRTIAEGIRAARSAEP